MTKMGHLDAKLGVILCIFFLIMTEVYKFFNIAINPHAIINDDDSSVPN